jgi:hypothetical protein
MRRRIIACMDGTAVPDVDDVVGLTRLHRHARANVRLIDNPEALIAEIEAQYRAAMAATGSGSETQFCPQRLPEGIDT